MGFKVWKDEKKTSTNDSFCEFIPACGVSFGQTTKATDMYLILSDILWITRVNWIVSYYRGKGCEFQCRVHWNRSHKAFAGLDALGPGMVEWHITGISTTFEPSTAASATTAFTRFLATTASGAFATCDRQGHARCYRGRFCLGNVGINMKQQMIYTISTVSVNTQRKLQIIGTKTTVPMTRYPQVTWNKTQSPQNLLLQL